MSDIETLLKTLREDVIIEDVSGNIALIWIGAKAYQVIIEPMPLTPLQSRRHVELLS